MPAWSRAEPEPEPGLGSYGVAEVHQGPTDEPDTLNMLCGYKLLSYSTKQGYTHDTAHCELRRPDGSLVGKLLFRDYEGGLAMTLAIAEMIKADGGSME